VRSRRRWLLAAAAPLAIWIALTCAVCKSVTGQATELPWTLYARQYMPDDGPGFGPTRAQLPERTAPEYLRVFIDELHAQRERYTLQVALSRIPEHLCTVTTFLPSELLWPLALLGLLLCADALLPVLLFALLFFLLQLTFYAPTPFYLLELAIPLSLGLAGAADKLFRAIRAMQSRALRLGALVAASLPAMALVAGAVDSMDTTKRRANAPNALARAEANLAPAAAVHGLVFIRYANRNSSPALHYNEPDLQRTPLLRALDLGPRNRELRALFPERPAFLYEVATGALTAL